MRGCDWYGSAVNVAARLAAQAEPNQALVSAATRTAAGGRLAAALDDRREVTLRGVSGHGGGVATGMTGVAENRDVARTALEQVCARGDMALAPRCYAQDFVDHVGRVEYRGLDGVRRSTELYRMLFDDLAFDVVDQVAEGDRVASRWVLTGSNRGRPVRLWGITISRLRDGRIVEDWSAFDGLELLRAPRPLAHPPHRPGIPATAAQAASEQTRALIARRSR